jgi:hypothetical protein
MFRRAASLFVVNLLVFVAAAELVALGIFYYQTGWLFYVDPYRPAFETVPVTQQSRLTSAALHPYFGPTHMPGVPFDMPENLRAPGAGTSVPKVATNNFGFTSQYDYPFVKTDPRQYVVGLFGGSVGAWFCEVGAERMVKQLTASAALRGRTIVPLCFSHGGYKQPQQLLILSYFLSIGQTFDAVVNIDGFNEVALSRLNEERGSDISMPSVMHMDPLTTLLDRSSLTPERLELLARIQARRGQLNRLSERLNTTSFAAVYVVLARVHRVVERTLQADQVQLDALPMASADTSLIRMTPRVRARNPQELYEDIAQNWVRASLLMHTMLAAEGISYVHVLQPNQYYTTRPFTPDQAATAVLEGSPFKPGAEQGYPRLERALESGQLARAGVVVVNGVHLFDRETSPVYIDNCCHYTRRGNELLADAVASAIVSASSRNVSAGAGPRSATRP